MMHLGCPWDAGLHNRSVKGLEGFHQRVKVVMQGMLRPLVQAPLHIHTSI